jgi:hypothetical protein
VKTVIFLGPSLPASEAQKILDAIYLPPARQSDIISAVGLYRPQVIGLIDGVFAQSLSVWHKEILYALERGILVYGASSMGALRAVETAGFGMVGLGRVYQMYASGELTDDDEVALVHGPAEAEYRNLSEPMVNLRMTFAHARDKGVIDAALCQQLTAIAKSIYFPERTFPNIFKAAAEKVPPDVLTRVQEFVAKNYIDVKRQDAILLLETLRDLPEPLAQPESNFALTRSHLFDTLYNRDRAVRHDDINIPLESIANYVALHMPDFGDFNFHALNRALVVVLADLLQAQVSQADIEKEIQRFRLKYRLTESEAFIDWLGRNDLDKKEFDELMREVALCRRLQRWLLMRKYMEGSVKILLDELRLQNRYDEWAEKAAFQEQMLQEHSNYFHETDHDDVNMQQLLSDHFRDTDCRMDTDARQWAEEAGFAAVEDLKIELVRSRLARKKMQELYTLVEGALAQ